MFSGKSKSSFSVGESLSGITPRRIISTREQSARGVLTFVPGVFFCGLAALSFSKPLPSATRPPLRAPSSNSSFQNNQIDRCGGLMPNRILKESVCSSRSLDGLTPQAEILFYRLVVVADDYGRFDANPSMIRARAFPLRIDAITNENVENWLGELSTRGVVETYEVSGVRYGFFPGWSKHQTIRAKRSKFPAPEIICKQMQANAPVIQSNPIQSESNPTREVGLSRLNGSPLPKKDFKAEKDRQLTELKNLVSLNERKMP
jgi:hypothetical protein